MSDNTPPRKTWLRKLRKGITIHFSGYDHDGIPHWMLYDAGRNKFFAIGWPEYEMLSRWHIGDGEKIIEAVNKETTLHLEMQDFENVKDFLYNHYLIEHRWRNVYQKAREHKLIKGENIFYWFIKYYLFFRIPLLHPDKFLEKTQGFGRFLFNRYTVYVMFALGLVAVYQIGIRWEEFVHTFSSIFSWQGLLFYFIAFTIAKFFHELGHAYMCRSYGISVPTMGVAFLVFWPVLYTDTTLSWRLSYKERLQIALAGMWVESYITIIAALIWCNVHNVTIQMICYVMVAVNWVGTILINISPFMRFDGYYVLSDLLKIPNLQTRSFELARWQIRNWLFGWVEPPHEHFSKNMHRILVLYAITTWIYRLIIYFGIALLVYHYFFKIIGIILFGIEIFAFILRPVVMELKKWYELRQQFTLNRRTLITIVSTIILSSLLLLPLNAAIHLNATLSYSHELLYAPVEAVLVSKLPALGSKVEEGQVIIKLKSSEIDYNLAKAKLQYQITSEAFRRSFLNPKFAKKINDLKAELSEKNSEQKKWMDLQEKLVLKAPFNGLVGDLDSTLYPGVTVMKGQWLLDIINPNSKVIEAYVNESDLDSLKNSEEGKFYPLNTDMPVIHAKIIAIEPINSANLAFQYAKELRQNKKNEFIVATPSYHASELGGKIPTETTEEGKYVPIESVYRVLFAPEENVELKNIQLGTVVVFSKPRSFLYKTFYKIKTVLVKETGF